MKSGHSYIRHFGHAVLIILVGFQATIAAAQSPGYYGRVRTNGESRPAATQARGFASRNAATTRAGGTTLTSASVDTLRPYSSQSVAHAGMRDDEGSSFSTRNLNPAPEPEPVERVAAPAHNYYPSMRSAMYPNANKVAPSSRHHICVPSCGSVLRATASSHAR